MCNVFLHITLFVLVAIINETRIVKITSTPDRVYPHTVPYRTIQLNMNCFIFSSYNKFTTISSRRNSRTRHCHETEQERGELPNLRITCFTLHMYYRDHPPLEERVKFPVYTPKIIYIPILIRKIIQILPC